MTDRRMAFAGLLALSICVLAATNAAAGTLDSIWVGVPGTVTPAGTVTNNRVSVRASGVDTHGAPRLLVRIEYRCGTAVCTTPELAAVLVALPAGEYTSYQYAVISLPPPAPQPIFFFALDRNCGSALGTEAMIGIWVTTADAPAAIECYYRQPAPQAPVNAKLAKVVRQINAPRLPPMSPIRPGGFVPH